MRLKKEKCEFMLEEVEYLGHKMSQDGLQPTQSKVAAVANAPEPTRMAELRSFLGLVNSYQTWLPLQPHCTTSSGRTPLGSGERFNNLPLIRSKLCSSHLTYLSILTEKRRSSWGPMLHLLGWGQCSCTAWKMGLKDLSPMLRAHFRWLSASTNNWIRRLWPLFMESNGSISMCMGGHL